MESLPGAVATGFNPLGRGPQKLVTRSLPLPVLTSSTMTVLDARLPTGNLASFELKLEGYACLDLKCSGRYEVRTTKGRKKVVKRDLVRNVDSREA